MACRRTRKLRGHWGVPASTVTLTLLMLAIPGIAQAASADVAGMVNAAVPGASAVPTSATTAASTTRSIASSTTARVAAAVPAAQPAAGAVAGTQAVVRNVTSGSSGSSPTAGGGSSSGAATQPSAVHSGSASSAGSSSEPIADTIVRHVETAVSGAIPHSRDVHPDIPVPTRARAVEAHPDPVARQGAPVTVIARSHHSGHRAPAGARRSAHRSSREHAAVNRGAGGGLLRPVTPGAPTAAAAWVSSAASWATGGRPGAVVPLSVASSPATGADHLRSVRPHARAGPRAARVDVAAPVDAAVPFSGALAPAGSEGTSPGVGAGTSAAAAAIVGLAGLWLLRALLPGLLTLDIFPWQSTLRAMRLERPG